MSAAIAILIFEQSYGAGKDSERCSSPDAYITPEALFTGVPSINVPVYTITSKKLSWPIALTYHAAGIKVDEIAGWVGLGWSLQGANAVVSRVMRGLPDEVADGYFQHASSIPDATDPISLQMKQDLADGVIDMMPDLFYFNTGAGRGRILFDNQLVPRTIPLNDFKISVNPQTLPEFVITAPDGTAYHFADYETTNTYLLGPDPDPFKSTWYLTRIVSADGSDEIKFNYTTYSYQYETNQQANLKYYYDAPTGATKTNHQIEHEYSVSQSSIPATKLLSSIVYSGGKLEFISSNRVDDASKKLDAIVVYYKDPFTAAYTEERRINFTYSYFGSEDTRRLKLEGIQHEALGQFLPAHRFEYLTKALPSITSFSQDHWGYYNHEGNSSLIPARQDGDWIIAHGNREIDTAYVAGCMLKKIISPMLGETEFVFESNQYLEDGVNKFGPGLRIKKRIVRDAMTGINAITNYEYTRPSDGLSSGKLMDKPMYDSHLPVVDKIGLNYYNYNCWLIHARPTGLGTFLDSPVLYEYATIYEGDDYSVAGKTTTKFNIYHPVYSSYPYSPEDDDTWTAGKVIEQEAYKVDGSTSARIQRVENDYEIHATTHQIKGLKAAYNKILLNHNPAVNDFELDNYFTYSKHQYLRESRLYRYEEDGGTLGNQTITTYHLDPELDHTFPIKIVSNTSDTGITLQEEISYPTDYTGGVFTKMQNLNMVGIPVERKVFSIQGSNENLISYSKYDYLDWGSDDIYVQSIYRPRIVSPVARSTFNSNPSNFVLNAATVLSYSDEGHPVETKSEHGEPGSVLIDPYHNATVASCSPASLTQIAYCGFETPYRGQWTVDQGSSQQTGNISLNLVDPSESFETHATQTISYTYSVTRAAGPSPTVTFSKVGTTPKTHTLSLASGNGNVSLSAGLWTVSVSAEWNVSSFTLAFTYQYTYWNPLNISTTAKTGVQSLSMQTGNTISKANLSAGDYLVSYYQRNGSISFSVSGGSSILGTETNTTEADGWTLVRKKVRIVNTSDNIQLTSSGCLIDELRLQPIESFMSTQSYDRQGRLRTSTDQNARSEYYEYDVWGRNTIVRDNDRNIVRHTEYKLASN